MDDFPKTEANYAPLTPVQFLRRAAAVHGRKTAIVHGELRRSYAEFGARARALASALRRAGIRRGDRVSVMLPNIPEMLEAHFGVPGAGAVLNAVNTRLDPAAVAFIVSHAESRILIIDREYEAAMRAASEARPDLIVIMVEDDAGGASGSDYERFLETGDPGEDFLDPLDEWDSIALNYTSGTTGDPKGVLYHHRGACLNAFGNAMTFGLSTETAYLWTLPMFHCNGWSYPWAVTAAGGTHVCLRRIEPRKVFALIAEERVTHLCAAPVVLTMLQHAPASDRRSFVHGPVRIATGGAAPPSAVIDGMERLGFSVTHLYGMTECFGPSTVCVPQEDWADLPLSERAALMARQGVNLVTLAEQTVLDTEDRPVPADGRTLGELCLRGNTVMKGYFRNPKATAETLRGGKLRTGDLAVLHPDGYVEIKDRAKDVIITGGENVSSLEVEEILYRHPAVMEAAVVARPDPKWGETPCAFVTLKPGIENVDAAEVIAFCRGHLAGFKIPRSVVFGDLPKTSTGKIRKYVLRERARELDEAAAS